MQRSADWDKHRWRAISIMPTAGYHENWRQRRIGLRASGWWSVWSANSVRCSRKRNAPFFSAIGGAKSRGSLVFRIAVGTWRVDGTIGLRRAEWSLGAAWVWVALQTLHCFAEEPLHDRRGQDLLKL